MYEIQIIQQPKQARQCSGKDRADRRPIDPPPIIEIPGFIPTIDTSSMFCTVTLVDPDTKLDCKIQLLGTTAQSLKKIKGHDNRDMNLFLFQHISVKSEGVFRLKFNLYCILNNQGLGTPSVSLACTVYSDLFRVYTPKLFPGMSESSFLTRLCANQGFRVRIRKSSSKQSNPPSSSFTSPSSHQQPHFQSPMPEFYPPPPIYRRHHHYYSPYARPTQHLSSPAPEPPHRVSYVRRESHPRRHLVRPAPLSNIPYPLPPITALSPVPLTPEGGFANLFKDFLNRHKIVFSSPKSNR